MLFDFYFYWKAWFTNFLEACERCWFKILFNIFRATDDNSETLNGYIAMLEYLSLFIQRKNEVPSGLYAVDHSVGFEHSMQAGKLRQPGHDEPILGWVVTNT